MTRILAMVAATLLAGVIAAAPAAAAPDKKPPAKAASSKSSTAKSSTAKSSTGKSSSGKPAKRQSGNVTRAEMKAQANGIFNRADTNHDGFMSAAEFRVRMNAVINRPPRGDTRPSRKDVQTQFAAAEKAFHNADGNGDGKLSRIEGTRRPLAAFDMMDANHDGILTLKEKAAALDAPSAQVVGPVQR